ncbi:hypothetical protein TorRG33x02_172240 [Trema orientale]|uniref:Uncharacterized protein n=1 Tax=Trema orientale TaxID=63057 RepID=A0A2P5EN48_TREOI|nr:hypothetical protein TorRG33x02_172240 [Trema orientale]
MVDNQCYDIDLLVEETSKLHYSENTVELVPEFAQDEISDQPLLVGRLYPVGVETHHPPPPKKDQPWPEKCLVNPFDIPWGRSFNPMLEEKLGLVQGCPPAPEKSLMAFDQDICAVPEIRSRPPLGKRKGDSKLLGQFPDVNVIHSSLLQEESGPAGHLGSSFEPQIGKALEALEANYNSLTPPEFNPPLSCSFNKGLERNSAIKRDSTSSSGTKYKQKLKAKARRNKASLTPLPLSNKENNQVFQLGATETCPENSPRAQ